MTTPLSRETVQAGGGVPYNFAVLRVVPHVHVGSCVSVGVLVHARIAEFIGMRVLTSVEALRARVPDVDAELLAQYLRACEAIAHGDPAAGPVALAPPSERFHWLTAPRSDVLQSSAVHEGICSDPAAVLDRLFQTYVESVGGAGKR